MIYDDSELREAMGRAGNDRIAELEALLLKERGISRTLELQIRLAQEVIVLCIDQGGLSFHVEGGKCPEDDTCDCPVKKKVDAAMKGYAGPALLCLTCGEGHSAQSKCAENREAGSSKK